MNIPRIAALALLSFTAPALASDPVPPGDDGFTVYSELHGWTVYADLERKSCLIEHIDAHGNAVQMGLTPNHRHGYVGVFTLADLDEPRREKVHIIVDGVSFEGKVHEIRSHKLPPTYHGGYILVKDENLVTALEDGSEMIAIPHKAYFPRKTVAFIVDLTGSRAAIEEARRCNLDQIR